MGEEGRPHGVVGGGRRARGVKGGEGRDESPVPPTMAMEIGSEKLLVELKEKAWSCTGVCCWEGGHGGVVGWNAEVAIGQGRKMEELECGSCQVDMA